ncbi:hypothetical protein V490_08985 [Pseudogymnoascus sp. VKM F-3557]|nr:hypothetical protein V490_08985 [Pseudogymnoascus sp. VKM F-3557]
MEPIHILNLPEDILYDIFKYFQCNNIHRGLFDGTRYEDTTNRQTVKTARLVCRLFNQLASRLLCPSIQVRIDHDSLDFLTKVSESIFVAESVYSIEIVLDYRPRELAEDLLRFGNHRARQLITNVHNECEQNINMWERGGYGIEIPDYPYSDYRQLMDYCSEMHSAWSGYAAAENNLAEDAISLEKLEIFRQGHREYIQKHEEQFQLITDGSFVNRLVSAMSGMSHCASVRFVDCEDCYSIPSNASPLTFRDDTLEFSRFMTAPLSWRDINRLDGGAENVSAKLLWELPIALHNAGLILRSIFIRRFPHPNWYPVNYPAPWTNLSAACQHLSEFHLESIILRGSSKPFDPLLGREQALIEQYMGAVLSSEALEVIVISFQDIDTIASLYRPSTYYRAGLLPEAINWPRIKRLDISHISFSQVELENFCSGLGYKIEDIRLCYMALRSGSWAGILDMLRERAAKKRQSCKYLYELTGGELGQQNTRLIEESRDYVNGVRVTENPLMGRSYST